MRWWIILLFLFILMACKPEEKAQSDQPKAPDYSASFVFRKDGSLSISDPEGNLKATFELEIASTVESRMQGLMNREKMEDNQAMLFIHEYADYHSFWMKDTYLALDMIFIDENSTVVFIEKNTIPFNEELITPDTPALYTLEVKAGICDRYKIAPGDKIKWTKL